MRRGELFWTVWRLPIDFLMLVGAGLFAYFLRTAPLVAGVRPVRFDLELPLEHYLILVVSLALTGIIIFALSGLYAVRNGHGLFHEVGHVAMTVSGGFMLLVLFIFVRGEYFNSRFIFLTAWAFAIMLVAFGRILLTLLERHLLTRRGFGSRRVLIIGKDALTQHIFTLTKENPHLGYRTVAVLAKLDIAEVRATIENPGIDGVILSDPDYPRERVVELIDMCNDNHLSFKFVPNLFQELTLNVGMDLFGDVPLIELKRTRLDGWGHIIKRAVDMAAAAILLVVLSPLFVLLAMIIKLDSQGPVFEGLPRISQGKKFNLFKFRSMIKDARLLKPQLLAQNERTDGGPLFKMKNDPRITRVGRVIRKTRLDEFAQLFNVLRGEMSLVGPRPHEPEEVAQYQKHHRKVLAIKPGITGLAQVSGASELPFEDEVRLDTFYVERWSLVLDIKILIKTFFVFIKGDKSAV